MTGLHTGQIGFLPVLATLLSTAGTAYMGQKDAEKQREEEMQAAADAAKRQARLDRKAAEKKKATSWIPWAVGGGALVLFVGVAMYATSRRR